MISLCYTPPVAFTENKNKRELWLKIYPKWKNTCPLRGGVGACEFPHCYAALLLTAAETVLHRLGAFGDVGVWTRFRAIERDERRFMVTAVCSGDFGNFTFLCFSEEWKNHMWTFCRGCDKKSRYIQQLLSKNKIPDISNDSRAWTLVWKPPKFWSRKRGVADMKIFHNILSRPPTYVAPHVGSEWGIEWVGAQPPPTCSSQHKPVGSTAGARET